MRRRSHRNEERRKLILSILFKIVLVVAAFGVTAYYSYEVGYRVVQDEVTSLKEQVEQAVHNAKAQEEQTVGANAALAEARRQLDANKALYEQVKPTEESKDIIAAVRAKLQSGMPPRHLELMIRQSPVPKECDQSITKHFMVRTGRSKGPASNIMTAALTDLVIISADGSQSGNGRDAWFDPERPITVHVSIAGAARDTELVGKLPIEQVVMAKNTDVHFTVSASATRGYVDVVSERCTFR